MVHHENSSTPSCKNLENCYCEFDGKHPTDACYFKDAVNEENDYKIELLLTIPRSVLSDKLTLITTTAELTNNVEDLGTDTIMSVVAYTNTGAILWSHRQDQNGQSLSRYIDMSTGEVNETTTDEIPIKLIFRSTTKQELNITVSLELKDIDIFINRRKMGTLKRGAPLVYKFDNTEIQNNDELGSISGGAISKV